MNGRAWSRAGYIYIYTVIATGLVVVIHSAHEVYTRSPSGQWLILAALTLLTGSFSVRIPAVSARISVSEAFVFASVLLFGPAPATLIVALDSFVLSLWQKADQWHRLRSVFNFSAVALAIWTAAEIFFALTGARPGNLNELLPLERRLPQLFALAGLYFLLNSWLVALALSFERGVAVLPLWRDNFPWFSINYFGGVSVAALLVSYSRGVDLNAIGIILPLLFISYLTYRTSLGRIEDARRHVEQLSALYMSTVETLAMAVDAKDQITHGHIRRVQVYALELAKRLGVADSQQLKAIEAAALLHDMGKLAIPEHILNKPGKLTSTEFEKMKQHAAIGADLLSAVNFPYPVVPIVRHHHEQWDGKGYPTGIAGTDIPLGARILSVVDCFDALTSDRPYRPRLSDADAFAILKERCGSMYDPLVVDAFMTCYPEIAPAAVRAGQEAHTLFGAFVADSVDDRSALRQIRSNAVETAQLLECTKRLANCDSPSSALTIAAECLSELTPARIFSFFRYDAARDQLRCEWSAGDAHGLLVGLCIKPAERITGWVAVNRRSSANADPALDLLSIATRFNPPLKSTLSTVVVESESLLGVLSIYSAQVQAFSDTHGYLTERIVTVLAPRLRIPASRALLRFGQGDR
jgi:putative nucleotidyltransferase with HDIG domain